MSSHKRKLCDDASTYLERAGSNAVTPEASYAADKRLRTEEPTYQAPVAYGHYLPQAQQAAGLQAQYGGSLLEHALSSPLQPATSLAGSSCGAPPSLFGGALADARPAQAAASSPLPGWVWQPEPAASVSVSACAPSVQGSEASEATVQASTPLSQGGWLQQQAAGLQRSNSAPDLRVLLATPLQPLLSIPQPVFAPPQYASASTAGALVPYKAPEEVVEDAYRSTAARHLQAAVEELKRRRREACQAQAAPAAAPGDAVAKGRAWPADSAAGGQGVARGAWPAVAAPHGSQLEHAEGRTGGGGSERGAPPGSQAPSTALRLNTVAAGWPPWAPHADAVAAAEQRAGGARAPPVPGAAPGSYLAAGLPPEAAWSSKGTFVPAAAGVDSRDFGAEAAEPMDMEE